MSQEFQFQKPGWVLIYEQRAWVPNWLYHLYAAICPPWLEPFRFLLNKKVDEE